MIATLLYLFAVALNLIIAVLVIRRRTIERSAFDAAGCIHTDLWRLACLLILLAFVSAWLA